jgi:hypothetical protein
MMTLGQLWSSFAEAAEAFREGLQVAERLLLARIFLLLAEREQILHQVLELVALDLVAT